MNHPVESVYSALTSILLPYMGEPVPVQRNCSCCGRAPSEFDGVDFELVNAYRERVVHCRPCQTFFVFAPELMGVENPKKPTTGQKFGMWSGVGAVINVEDNSSVLLAPQVDGTRKVTFFWRSAHIPPCLAGCNQKRPYDGKFMPWAGKEV